MSKGNGKTDDNVEAFPPVSDLGAFHAAVADIRACVGNDHDKTPAALFCLVIREGEMAQFVLGAEDYAVTLLGALELAKLDLASNIDLG